MNKDHMTLIILGSVIVLVVMIVCISCNEMAKTQAGSQSITNRLEAK
ncbi:MAG: hypothetical protein PHQ12_07425 [Chthoniobacteraceae bacterium]|nr:hypothetical protein [Chthoniobacteraceae bacterium]